MCISNVFYVINYILKCRKKNQNYYNSEKKSLIFRVLGNSSCLEEWLPWMSYCMQTAVEIPQGLKNHQEKIQKDFFCLSQACQHNTTGAFCDQCLPGFYGNPSQGTAEDCHPCACPLSSATNK